MAQLTNAVWIGSGDFLLGRLHEEVSRAARHGIPLACLLFRVEVPPATDPAIGERLAHAASVLARHMVRHSDVVAILGSGCFGILANATGEGARTLADVLTRELHEFTFLQQGQEIDLDVSYGISCLHNGQTPLGLLEEARAALHGSCSRAAANQQA